MHLNKQNFKALTRDIQLCCHECWCDWAQAVKTERYQFKEWMSKSVFGCSAVLLSHGKHIHNDKISQQLYTVYLWEKVKILQCLKEGARPMNSPVSVFSQCILKSKNHAEKYQNVWWMWKEFLLTTESHGCKSDAAVSLCSVLLKKSGWAITHVSGDLWFLLSVL